jgi:endoglucanase
LAKFGALTLTAAALGIAGCGAAATPGVSDGGVSAGVTGASPTDGGIRTVVLGTSKSRGTPAPATPGKNVPAIKIDTVGYPVGWQKIAIFNVDPSGAVIKDASGKVVLTVAAAQIIDKGTDRSSKDPVWQVDFSALDAPGRYTLEVGAYKSDVFSIGTGIYDEAILAGLKSFYFQRTRTALEKPYAMWKGDAYTRATASHVHQDVGWDLEDYPEKKRKWKLDGGWHDAGNFDMYVPSTAPSAQTLLMAYEWAPQRFGDKALNIPESGNGIPDILDETKWGLIWILSMQEPGGAFRHRESVMKWSPEGPADKDKTVRWVAGVSTAATAKAVSVLALAARIYPPHDASFAKRCETAARKGWAFLENNPKRIKVDGKGSEQPKWDDEPGNSEVGARFIAATEMWRSFRIAGALEKAKSYFSAKELAPDQHIRGAWANLSRWGLATLALDTETPAKLRARAKKRIIDGAELLRTQSAEKDGYRCASTKDDYYWAHNSNLMEKAHVLALAAKLSDDGARYRQAARDQWHWVLGRNPNGYSMVTRVGKGPTRLYHMEWGNNEPPPPGFLIGGPNYANMAFLAPGAPAKALLWENTKKLRSGVPAGSMWHWKQSDLWDGGFVKEGGYTVGWWAVTEPDILYSANLVLAGVASR